ncbi:MAG: biotin--[acetyl-CoA-carboxylase] ligase [Clostridiales bacterium]|jgi:BirA family biotin operon repressor/biotin-[acetyl-CoA-carboxylase] ligase|nr:biotin--[acetyl-CoA-carboxylase] ligase [Clostridiales bacterium]
MLNTSYVLARLLAADGPVSGEELARSLSVSRMTVSGYVESLRAGGFAVASRTRTGYTLLDKDADVLSREALEARLPDWTAEYHAVHPSTNTAAKAAAAAGARGLLVAAGCQPEGRGRRGRSFASKEGGCYFSLVYTPTVPCDAAMRLTLAAGIAVATALRQCGATDVALKYPNDVWVSGKKICGILTETASDGDTLEWAVTGIGINVRNELPRGVAATSLAALGIAKPRAALISEVTRALQALWTVPPAALLEAYRAFDVITGRDVWIEKDNARTPAYAEKITENGYLQVRTEAGSALVSGADVSIRMHNS